MLKYVPYALQALFVIGGVAIGAWAKSMSPAGAPADVAAVEQEGRGGESHGGKDTAPKDKGGKPENKAKKETGHNGDAGKSGHGADGAEAYGFLKFSRQFVVPIVDATGVRSLVVMEINIEVPPNATESIYTREPKIRDSLLMALLKLSNEGAFNEKLLEQKNLDSIRQKLLAAAQVVIGEDAQNVLILNITRQDV